MPDPETPDDPPAIAPWLLHLRFALEVGSLIGVGAWARRAGGPGVLGWIAGVAAALLVATAWGVFAVPKDPTRSARAPVPVPGWLRFVLEMGVFFGGAVGLASMGWWNWFDGFVGGFLFQHIGTRARVLWLLRQK